MPRLSDIEVALTAQDKTGSAFSSAKRNMESFGKVAGALIGSAALVGGALIAAGKSAIDLAGSITDAANAAGLSIETYQALRQQAGLAGVAADQFDSAMSRATKTIGDAATGNAAAAQRFANLGIAVRDAAGNVRPTEDVVRDLADRIADMGTMAEKSSAAAGIFGRSAGPALVPMLDQGAQGIDTFIERGKEMGLVISEELVRKGDEAGDKLDTLADTIKVTFAGALLEVAPLVSEMATDLAEAAVAAADWWQAIRGTDEGQKRVNRLAEEIISTQRAIDGLTSSDALTRWMGGGQDQVDKLRAELKELQADLARTGQVIGGRPSAAPRPRPGATGKTDAELDAEKAAEDERKRLARERAAAEKAALRDVSDFAGAEQIRQQLVTEEYYANLAQQRDDFIRDSEAALPGLMEDVFASVSESSGQTVATALEAFESIQDKAAAAADRTLEAFDSILFAGFTEGTDGMLDAFRGVVADMVLELAKARLKEALTSVFGSILGAVGGTTTGGELSKSTSSAGTGALKEFARGGSFTVPGPPTGDRVVPIFRANGGETVTVTPKGQGGGGITIVQNINAPGATAETVALIRSESAKAARTAVGEVINMRQRGRL